MKHYTYADRFDQGCELVNTLIRNGLVSDTAKHIIESRDADLLAEDYWQIYEDDGIDAVVAAIEAEATEYKDEESD